MNKSLFYILFFLPFLLQFFHFSFDIVFLLNQNIIDILETAIEDAEAKAAEEKAADGQQQAAAQ